MTSEGFMFWHLREKNGLKYLAFEGWNGVRVFYSTRIGGISPSPYDTLNLHFGRGDTHNNVKLNRKRFFDAVSIDEKDVVYTEQTHSDIVNIVQDSSKKLKGDGLITAKKGLFLGVFTADCLAVFLCCQIKKVIGVLHSGRRGAEQGIVKKGISELCETFDIEEENIEALFGPSIGPCCYKVGKKFQKKFNGACLIKKGKNFYLNMWRMVRDQLEGSGVKKILVPEICSFSSDDLFYSYRKSGERVGENLGIIGMPTR